MSNMSKQHNKPAMAGIDDSPFTGANALKRLKRRQAAERRFQAYSATAIGLAVLALFVLFSSIISQAQSAFSKHYLRIDLPLERRIIAPDATLDPVRIESNISGFNKLVKDRLILLFPDAASATHKTRALFAMLPRLGVLPVARKTAANLDMLGTRQTFDIVVSDDADLFLKQKIGRHQRLELSGATSLQHRSGPNYTLTGIGRGQLATSYPATPRAAGQPARDILVRSGQNWFTLVAASETGLDLKTLTVGASAEDLRLAEPLEALILETVETDRNISNYQIALLTHLQDQGRIIRKFNFDLLSRSDSTYPELAGAAAAIAGSILTMLVTAIFAIPIGILAAIYLEEFARKNWLTGIIQVNINNLAAVPSIIFGLLGAAIFLNIFNMPRSIPLVGGLVLGLLILPTIIMASQAALQAVPQSVRNAALGIGATRAQTVFHHTLPLAAPGIITGAIIGMARALGETAPLLLIGMVAFVNEVPTSPDQEATVLPVLIFKWFSGAERAWEPMTSALVLVLVGFLIIINLIAVAVRLKFDRRWSP